MVTRVKKRDGTVEGFSADKIAKSAMKAGAPELLARKIAEDAKTSPDLKDETSTANIRAFVLVRLQKENLAWDHAWREYEFSVKHRSKTGKPVTSASRT